MKKLSLLLVLAMLLSCACFTASAEGEYTQAPWFDAAVEAGELPPVEERLPENPCYIKEVLDEYLDQEVGIYGGTLRFPTNSVNWDADIFVSCNEALLTMESANSDQITPNVVESYSVNEDNTVYTFTLRKGLKWSDGTPVTMADVEFGVNNYIFNEELTPVISSYMRDGGVAAGDPFTFTVVDDWTFEIAFKTPYGGFPVHISIAGWKGYTDFIKPAHVLKQFHKDYAEECHGSLEAYYEFIAPFGAVMFMTTLPKKAYGATSSIRST
jgi:peptide/nickel transport system substrate-binding protein